jgi:hypothetical protein
LRILPPSALVCHRFLVNSIRMYNFHRRLLPLSGHVTNETKSERE